MVVASSLMTTYSLVNVEREEIGEAGGGIATALGIRGLGVSMEDLLLFVGNPTPIPETRPLTPGFGVDKGETESRVGDKECMWLEFSSSPVGRDGLLDIASRELSCLAVIDIYFDAREPAVIFSERKEVRGFEVVECASEREDVDAGKKRAEGVAGVTLPLLEGVIRPLDIDDDTVMRDPDFNDALDGVICPDIAGVTRPPREDATEDGRWIAPGPTVGGESLTVDTKTPQRSGQTKYCFLII